MNISAFLDDLREDNKIEASQLSNSIGLRFYNDGRDILIDGIIAENEDYFYNEIFSDTVIGQREYKMPKRGDLSESGEAELDGLLKIKGVSIKSKSTDISYIKLTPRDISILREDLLSYNNSSEPFYVISDNSVFIYPTPTENINDGLLIYGIFLPKKLLLTNEDTLPDNRVKAIYHYILYRYYKSTKQLDEANLSYGEFQRELLATCSALSGRVNTPITRTAPDLSYLS